MKCQDFENNVMELLRGELNKSRRAEALAHALACKRCAALLEDERRLSAELHALAAGHATEQAPGRVEQQLLTAFRVQSESRAGSLTPTPPELARTQGELRIADCGLRISNTTQRAGGTLLPRWGWAAVAAAVVLCALVVHLALRNPSSQHPAKAKQQSTAPMNAKQQTPGDPPFADTGAAKSAAPVSAKSGAPKLAKTGTSNGPAVAKSGEPSSDRAPVKNGAPRRVAGGRRPQPVPQAVDAEVATDFYSIPYVQPVRPEESMRLVRTRVPRSSLAIFGLPVNDERALDPIRADVLVGEDNVARAIRFVQRVQTVQAPPGSARPVPVNARFVR